jgi:hypothetical protein
MGTMSVNNAHTTSRRIRELENPITDIGEKWKMKRKALAEKWAEIEEFPGYFVSNQGNVRRTGAKNKAGNALPDREINGSKQNGRKFVTINGKSRSVGKLVATSFLPPPDDPRKVYASHINRKKWDDRVENLKWEYPMKCMAKRFSSLSRQAPRYIGVSAEEFRSKARKSYFAKSPNKNTT